MGWPYLARFSAVSGTGPLVTMVVVTLAPEPKLVADVAVAPVEALVSLVVVDVELEVVVSVVVDGVVVVVVDVVVSLDVVGWDELVVLWVSVVDEDGVWA